MSIKYAFLQLLTNRKKSQKWEECCYLYKPEALKTYETSVLLSFGKTTLNYFITLNYKIMEYKINDKYS